MEEEKKEISFMNTSDKYYSCLVQQQLSTTILAPSKQYYHASIRVAQLGPHMSDPNGHWALHELHPGGT